MVINTLQYDARYTQRHIRSLHYSWKIYENKISLRSLNLCLWFRNLKYPGRDLYNTNEHTHDEAVAPLAHNTSSCSGACTAAIKHGMGATYSRRSRGTAFCFGSLHFLVSPLKFYIRIYTSQTAVWHISANTFSGPCFSLSLSLSLTVSLNLCFRILNSGSKYPAKRRHVPEERIVHTGDLLHSSGYFWILYTYSDFDLASDFD